MKRERNNKKQATFRVDVPEMKTIGANTWKEVKKQANELFRDGWRKTDAMPEDAGETNEYPCKQVMAKTTYSF